MQFVLMLFHFLLTILKISCLREISESGHTLQGDRHQPRQAVNPRQAGVECRTALCWVLPSGLGLHLSARDRTRWRGRTGVLGMFPHDTARSRRPC